MSLCKCVQVHICICVSMRRLGWTSDYLHYCSPLSSSFSAKVPLLDGLSSISGVCLHLSALGLVVALYRHPQLLYVVPGDWTLIFSLQGKHFYSWVISPNMHVNYKKLAHVVWKAEFLLNSERVLENEHQTIKWLSGCKHNDRQWEATPEWLTNWNELGVTVKSCHVSQIQQTHKSYRQQKQRAGNTPTYLCSDTTAGDTAAPGFSMWTACVLPPHTVLSHSSILWNGRQLTTDMQLCPCAARVPLLNMSSVSTCEHRAALVTIISSLAWRHGLCCCSRVL